jgi:chromosomal replication initiation ATPase DnaA
MTAQLPFAFEHRAAMGNEDFLVTGCNAEAVAWLDRWPEWPAPGLVIHGPPGCGKTHLAHVWRARTGAALVAAEALATTDPVALMAGSRCCVVEDADRGVDERALLHLYNLAAELSGYLLITAGRPPSRWDLSLADLRSRLTAAPAVVVKAPDDALMSAVLAKLFADRQIQVGQDVIDFLLVRLERSFDAARRAVAVIDAAALAAHRRITVPLVRDQLHRDGFSRKP